MSHHFKVLAIDTLHKSIHELVQSLPLVLDYMPNIDKEAILTLIPQYDGIILRSKIKIDLPFLQIATRLKWVARAGSGLDTIDLREVENRNIILFNAPEGNRDAVAEHTIGLLLALFRKTMLANAEVKNGIWQREQNRGYELKGKTVGIIGYGNVGTEVAKRLMAFGCEVLVYDLKYKLTKTDNHKQVTMEAIFQNADIVSFHVPLTPLTNGLVDEAYLSNFKKNIWLINTSRGEIVDLIGLCKALTKGKVLGVALDVLENEKLNTLTPLQQITFQSLVMQDNVLLTPHIAGWTYESYERINQVLIGKIKQWFEQSDSNMTQL